MLIYRTAELSAERKSARAQDVSNFEEGTTNRDSSILMETRADYNMDDIRGDKVPLARGFLCEEKNPIPKLIQTLVYLVFCFSLFY